MLYFNQIPNLTRNTEILGILSKIEGCLNGIVVPTADIGKHFLLLLEAAAAAMRRSGLLLGLVGGSSWLQCARRHESE